MALTSGFFNSVNHDRMYDALQMSQLFDGLITDGVYMEFGDHLQVRPQSGMTVMIGSGRAWFNHTWTYNDTDLYKTLAASDVIFDRIDAVVLKVDTSITVRENNIVIVKGEPGDPAQKPEFVNTSDVHYYPLAYVTVHKNATSIAASDIESAIGTAECPFVSGVVQGLTIDEWMVKFQEAFNVWFDAIKGQLDSDAAGHLQNEIDDINEREFRRYYDTCTRNTTYTKNGDGIVTGFSATNAEEDTTLQTTFTYDENNTLTVVEVVTTDTHRYTTTTVYNGVSSTQTTTKEAL